MRKHMPLLAALVLFAPAACKDNDKSGATGTSKQVTFTCDKCTKTKDAPASQAPS